jgi:DHA2 family multidrug resistance protein-like MFS transporter
MSSPAVVDGLPKPQRAQAMAAVVTAIALATLDTAIANTALPTIATDLAVSPEAAVWIVNAYQLGLVAALLPLASLGESIGQRRVHLSGIALFTVASVLCAVAWSLPTLIVARVIQGLGAAAIMAANIALIRTIYPARMLGRGVGLNALVVGASFAIGPTVASMILLFGRWPWLFAVNLPIGLVSFALAKKAMPETLRSNRAFDRVAAVLAACTFSLLVLGLEEAAHGAPLIRCLPELVLAFAAAVLLLRRQAGHAAPMLAIDLLRRPFFALSAVTAVCAFAAQGLAFVSLPFLLQHGFGYTQVATGFLMTPWPIVVAVMAPIAGRLSDRYAPGLLGGTGLALLSLGLLCVSFFRDATSTHWIIVWMAVCGMGFGLFQSPNLRAFMTSAPAHRSGSASGVAALVRLLGQSTGAALVAACFIVVGAAAPWVALRIGAGFALVGSAASLMRVLHRSGHTTT